MKIQDLKDRTILIVSRDVANPKPDRRCSRHFDAMPVWHKGTALMYRHGDYATLEHPQMYGNVYQRHEGFQALLDACELAPRTLDNVLWRARHGNACTRPSDVLETFLAQGRITLDDVEAAIATYEAKELAEGEAA